MLTPRYPTQCVLNHKNGKHKPQCNCKQSDSLISIRVLLQSLVKIHVFTFLKTELNSIKELLYSISHSQLTKGVQYSRNWGQIMKEK